MQLKIKKIPNNSHINIINEEINKIKNSIELNDFYGEELILENFYDRLVNLEEMTKTKTEYSTKIKYILDNYKCKKAITIKYIQNQYKELYNDNISLMTISRILRYHLKIFYRKTTLKNPKLLEDEYFLMSYGFIIGIIKYLELNFDLVYIDECGFQIQNNNLRYWRKENDEIYGGPKTNNKSKINLILAINKKEILLGHLYKNETIGSNEFLDFIINLIDLIGEDKINNTIFILDNSSYHLSKQIKEYIKKNKIKFLFNVPYKSNFNAIEMCFHFFKNKIYKEIFNNINSLEKRINNLIMMMK